MTTDSNDGRQKGELLAAVIEADEVDGPLTDDRIHVQASQDKTACDLLVSNARCADIGETVNCPECMAWLDEAEEVDRGQG